MKWGFLDLVMFFICLGFRIEGRVQRFNFEKDPDFQQNDPEEMELMAIGERSKVIITTFINRLLN